MIFNRVDVFVWLLRAGISMPVLAIALADRARETGVFPERPTQLTLEDMIEQGLVFESSPA